MFFIAILAGLICVHGKIDFDFQESAVIGMCINSSVNAGDSQSFINRCTNNSIWQFVYDDDECAGAGYSSNSYSAGCLTNLYGEVDRCIEAMAAGGTCKYALSSSSSNVAYPIDKCINSGSSSSEQYVCYSDSVYYLTYNDAECEGTVASNSSYASPLYSCSGNDCGVVIPRYSLGSSDSCNYQDGVDFPNPSTTSYFIPDNDDPPLAIGLCNSAQQGYYSWSYMYKCTSDGDVEEMVWLDNDECDDDDSGTVVGTYSAQNVTVSCEDGENSVSRNTVRVRLYTCNDAGTDTSDCEICSKYVETYYVSGICTPLEFDPESSDDEQMYYMTNCDSSGLLTLHYFVDGECSEHDAYEDDIDYTDSEDDDFCDYPMKLDMSC